MKEDLKTKNLVGNEAEEEVDKMLKNLTLDLARLHDNEVNYKNVIINLFLHNYKYSCFRSDISKRSYKINCSSPT